MTAFGELHMIVVSSPTQISIPPPLPPYHPNVAKYQLESIIEEMKSNIENGENLNTLERILWLTLPENLAERYDLFLRIADLQGWVK